MSVRYFADVRSVLSLNPLHHHHLHLHHHRNTGGTSIEQRLDALQFLSEFMNNSGTTVTTKINHRKIEEFLSCLTNVRLQLTAVHSAE